MMSYLSKNPLLSKLTQREIEILRLIFSGKNTKQISKELVISPRTVEKHRANIFCKFDVSSITQMVDAIFKNSFKLEQKIAKSEAHLREAQQIAKLGSWNWIISTDSHTWSDEVYHIFGYAAHSVDWTIELFFSLLDKNDLEFVKSAINDSIVNNSPFNIVYLVHLKDGVDKYIHALGIVDHDDAGNVIGMTGTVQDITQQKLLQIQLEKQAHYDYLTGIYNRGFFMQCAEIEIARSYRYGNSLSIFMIDIDYFKQINDNYGHKAGDLVLIKLAFICKKILRETDIFGRIGGEEFAILLPETTLDRSIEVAERVRTEVDNTKVEVRKGLSIKFSVSIGVSSISGEGQSIDMMLDSADKALYIAKNAGRNHVHAIR